MRTDFWGSGSYCGNKNKRVKEKHSNSRVEIKIYCPKQGTLFKDCFEQKTFEFIRQREKPLRACWPDSKQKLLRNENGCKSSLPVEFYGHEDNEESFLRQICAQYSYSIGSPYIYLSRVCFCGSPTTLSFVLWLLTRYSALCYGIP